jgi:ubiquinone/menaquinone biosynthesis C-methylase UbiE
MKNPTERFSDVVENYVKYRPFYPPEMLQALVNACDLTKDTIIADVGSGTGLLSQLFLEQGNVVYGVEPNEAMRIAAEHDLKGFTNFHSVNGTAEATSLASHSVNLVTAGTAFHWFDADKTKQEFQRILKPDGWALLVWNVRNTEESALMREYENLCITFSEEYKNSRAEQFDKTALKSFFAPNPMHLKSYRNTQQFDWQGLKGRLLSVSYILKPDHIRYEEMLAALKNIFDRHQKNGHVEFLYATKMYYGQLEILN